MTDAVSDPDCIFCRIVAGEIPARQVYADEHAVAFLDVAPWHRGHTLVVPRRHVADLVDGEPGALVEVAPVVEVVARRLVDRLGADGVNLLSSTGAAAGQTVFHLHLHVVPRYADRPGLAALADPAPDAADDLDAVHAALRDSS